MITIELNGDQVTIEPDATLTHLVQSLELAGKRIAIELNQEIIPKSAHGTTLLRAGDRVEIVHAIGGG